MDAIQQAKPSEQGGYETQQMVAVIWDHNNNERYWCLGMINSYMSTIYQSLPNMTSLILDIGIPISNIKEVKLGRDWYIVDEGGQITQGLFA